MMNEGFIPVYKRLTGFYRERILRQEYPPGQKIDSINKIIHRHGVGRETAKLVLKNLAKDGLIVKIRGKGSFVAPQQDIKKNWGLLIPFFSSNMEELIANLEKEANRRGRELVYYFDYNNPEEEKRLVGRMIRDGYEAVIIVPNYNESITSDFYRNLMPGHTKILLIDNTMAGSFFSYVIQSYDLGVKRALDYLAAFSGNLLLVKNEIWKGRNLLYESMEHTFINLANRDYPERKVFTLKNAGELTGTFVKDQNITGILTCVDTDAVRLIGRLQNWGTEPGKSIRLVSYGNTELTVLFNPPITSIDCHYDQMAQTAGVLLDNREAQCMNCQFVIQPTLIERKT